MPSPTLMDDYLGQLGDAALANSDHDSHEVPEDLLFEDFSPALGIPGLPSDHDLNLHSNLPSAPNLPPDSHLSSAPNLSSAANLSSAPNLPSRSAPPSTHDLPLRPSLSLDSNLQSNHGLSLVAKLPPHSNLNQEASSEFHQINSPAGSSHSSSPQSPSDSLKEATTGLPNSSADSPSKSTSDSNSQINLTALTPHSKTSEQSPPYDNDQNHEARTHSPTSGSKIIASHSISNDHSSQSPSCLQDVSHAEKASLPDSKSSLLKQSFVDSNAESGLTRSVPSPSPEAAKNESTIHSHHDEQMADHDDSATVIKQTHSIIIPSYASWFNSAKIHSVERESLPEFFVSTHPSKSPKIYIGYRNFMINLYRLNPNEFLTLTSCRRNLVGDVGTLMRVHRFLNKWGLINYQVSPEFRPGYALENLPNGQSVGLPVKGDYHVKYDTPRGLFPFDTHKPIRDRIDVPTLQKLVAQDSQHEQSLTRDTTGEKSLKRPMSGDSDSVPRKKRPDDWSAEHTAALVKAVDQHRNDWYKIAEEVGGSKSIEQCIQKFLQLPIEDKYLEDTGSKSLLGLLQYAPNFPVSAVDNPVLSTLAFLTQLVDSDVAKAASTRASKALNEKMAQKIASLYDESLADKKTASDTKSESQEQLAMHIDDEEPNITEKDNDTRVQADEGAESDVGDSKSNGSGGDEAGSEETHSALSEQVIKEAAETSFGIIGARSHLFACYEEREMNRICSSLVSSQIQKIDLKLEKIKDLESIHEREVRDLAKQKEQVFLDRLALTRSTISVSLKLEEALAQLEQHHGGGSDSSSLKVRALLADAKDVLFKPVSLSLVLVTSDQPLHGDSLVTKALAEEENIANEDFKPLSMQTPQAFKLWTPN